jgi:hypothetical protein
VRVIITIYSLFIIKISNSKKKNRIFKTTALIAQR